MFRPFFYITVSFIAGIIFQTQLGLDAGCYIAVSILLFIRAAVLFFKDKLNNSFILTITVFFFLGGLHLSLEDAILPENHIKNLAAFGKINLEKNAEIKFRLLDIPDITDDECKLRCKIEEIKQHGKTFKATGLLTVFCGSTNVQKDSTNHRYPTAGDFCRIVSKVKQIQTYRNETESRFSDFRIREKQYFTANISSLEAVNVIEKRNILNIRNLALSQKANLAEKIDKYFPDSQESSLLKAVTLGTVDEEMTKLRYQLRMGGIFHIVSVSGVHFSILAVSLVFAFKWLGASLKQRYVFTILSLIFFCFLVGAYPSVLRATLMACLYFTAKLLGKMNDFLNTISLACFVILMINPMNLFSPGFQFTFIVSYFIYYFLEGRKSTGRSRLQFKLYEVFLVSFAAFLASIPLNAYHFNSVSIISLLNNILLVPLMFVVMNGALLFFIFALTGIPLIFLIKPVLSIACNLILKLSTLCSNISVMSYRIPTPSIWLVLFYFLLLVIIMNKKKKSEKLRLNLMIFIFLLFLIIVYPFPRSIKSAAEMEMIDVGQGQSIFIKTQGGKTILIDGGGNHSCSEFMGERVISRFLWNKGIKSIDLLILTHAHYDHAAGLWPVARNFRIKEFWENGLNPLQDEPYKMLMENLDKNCLKRTIREGYTRKTDGLEILCLSPETDAAMSEKAKNNDSLVLFFKSVGLRFLITGDIETETADDLSFRYGNSLKADILQVPHHGSFNGLSTEFLDFIKPKIALLSVGKGNIFGFPSEKVMNSLLKKQIKIYRTDYNGKIKIGILNKKLSVQTAL